MVSNTPSNSDLLRPTDGSDRIIPNDLGKIINEIDTTRIDLLRPLEDPKTIIPKIPSGVSGPYYEHGYVDNKLEITGTYYIKDGSRVYPENRDEDSALFGESQESFQQSKEK